MQIRLKFLAKGTAPERYEMEGALINGLDVSGFPVEARFVLTNEMIELGVYEIERDAQELRITLGQAVKSFQLPVAGSEWAESGWIALEDYEPRLCFVRAVTPHAAELLQSGKAEYWQDPEDGAWTVRLIEQEDAA